MSSRSFIAPLPKGGFAEVQGGWDRPMNWHYLVVSKFGMDDDTYLFSNLEQDDANIAPERQVQILEQLGLPVPENWVQDLWADVQNPSLTRHYGTLGMGTRFEVLTPNGHLTSVGFNVYENLGRTVVLFLDDDQNQGLSVINAIEFLVKQFYPHPWIQDSDAVQWIVGSLNTYGPKPELAEYAQWQDQGWRFVPRDSLIAQTGDDSIPKWRGDLPVEQI